MTQCAHDWTAHDGELHIVVVADDWQGATTAIARCSGCGLHVLLQLLAWQGKHLENRVYILSPIPSQVALVFMRDIQSNYCDLTRHGQEFDALIAATDPAVSLVATKVPGFRIAAVHEIPPGTIFRVVNWRELGIGATDGTLLALLEEIAA